MRIDCRSCEMYQSDHCNDCLVTAMLHPIDAPVDVEADLKPSLDELAGAGLIPVLKFRPRTRSRPPEGPSASEAV